MHTTGQSHVSFESYLKGNRRYDEQGKFWREAKSIGVMMWAMGAVFAAAMLGLSALISLPLTDIGPSTTIVMYGIAFFILAGLSTQFVSTVIIKSRRLNDFDYRMALYFMEEMDVLKPKKSLNETPRYLEAYKEVRKAVEAIESREEWVDGDDSGFSINAIRIASLVLRDQRSLDMSLVLINLINDRSTLDYESLAAILNNQGMHHRGITQGVL